MELFFGLIGANLPQGFLGLLAIIAGLVVIALAFVFVVDLLLSIIAPNTRGIFFRRHIKDDKQNQPIKVTNTTTTTTTSTITAYEDEDTAVNTQIKSTPTNQVWDDDLVEKEQEELLAGGNGMADDFADFEQKSFSSDREDAINRRRQEFEDFDNLYNVDENNDASDINALIDEINEYAVAQYYNQDAEDTTLVPEANEEEIEAIETQQVEQIYEQQVFLQEDDTTIATQTVADVEEAPVAEEATAVETTDVADSEGTIAATASTEDTIVEPVEAPVETPATEDAVATAEAATTDVDTNVETVVVTKTIVHDIALEQLENRLQVLQDRLKANEKDLKANRKEYLPLARVKKTLEKDQEKLRRREAIVARKKVILYGVNNYVDIDEEKAKKLSEDLDLLDGLRLSVQHCEDVMNANKDRFPILEKTNKILVDFNKDLKSDIAEIQNAIDKYKSDNNID